jgi:hypothetical protein
MGQSISRCGEEQKQKTMRDKPHRNRRELTATAQLCAEEDAGSRSS